MKEYEFGAKELDNFFKKIGENVKRIRTEKNITQMELALTIGHNSVGHIAKAELQNIINTLTLNNFIKLQLF